MDAPKLKQKNSKKLKLPLREVRSTTSTGPNKKLIVIITAVVLLVIVGLFFAFRGGNDTNTTGGGETDGQEQVDSVGGNGGDVEPKPEPNGGDGKVANPNDLGWAVYDGPLSNGKPHGTGGTLTIKKNYSIDLKDANGTKVEVEKGDKIVSTIFKNGKLTYGELHRKNGERKPLNIGI